MARDVQKTQTRELVVPDQASLGMNRQLVRIPFYVFLVLISFAFLYPFVFMVSVSLKETTSLFVSPTQLIPEEPTLSNYLMVFSQIPITRWLSNSLFVATATTALKLLIDSMAGYAFARLEFKFKNLIFIAMIGTMMVPVAVTMVPRFLILRETGLLNTYAALILPALSYPLGVFLMRQAISLVPIELEEAARLDGCTTFGIFFRIVLPLVTPALAVVAITTFMLQWVDLLWPTISVSTTDLRTITVGIASMKAEQTQDWGILMAANFASFFPILILFLFLQRYFMAGLTSGAVK